jgi:hypothetical protein
MGRIRLRPSGTSLLRGPRSRRARPTCAVLLWLKATWAGRPACTGQAAHAAGGTHGQALARHARAGDDGTVGRGARWHGGTGRATAAPTTGRHDSGRYMAAWHHRPGEGSGGFSLGRGGGCWRHDEETTTVVAGLGSTARGRRR